MLKNILLLLCVSFMLGSCGASRTVTYIPKKTKRKKIKKTIPTPITSPTLADKVVWTAVTYKGTPYKHGGITNKGMDCSGLIYTSFKKRNIFLPRSSSLLYNSGKWISMREVKRGDLLFFKTSRRRGKVNHVALVTSVKNGDIRFIHATSSRGVIVSSLYSNYWKKAFVAAKRVL